MTFKKESCLFELPTDGSIELYTCFFMCSVLQTSLQFKPKCFRSVCTLICLNNYWQVYKLDQFVTIQHLAVHIQGIKFTIRHTSSMDHGPTAIWHSSEEGYFIMWTGSNRQFVKMSYESNPTFHG
jgi:hypothetical protein